MIKHLAILIYLDIHSVNFKKEEFNLFPEKDQNRLMLWTDLKGLIFGTWELMNDEVLRF